MPSRFSFIKFISNMDLGTEEETKNLYTTEYSDTDTTSTAGMLTPTTVQPPSEFGLDFPVINSQTRSAVPWPGSTFIIKSASSDLVLTLRKGDLVMLAPGEKRTSIYWDCVENDKGWLGFRNPISGNFMGHDGGDGIICNVRHHTDNEFLLPRVRPDGTFSLYCFQKPVSKNLFVMGVGERKGLGEGEVGPNRVKCGQSAQAYAWEFIKVE